MWLDCQESRSGGNAKARLSGSTIDPARLNFKIVHGNLVDCMKKIVLRLMIALTVFLQGCSVMTIMDAPDVEYDVDVLKGAGVYGQVMMDNFGDPVETISYRNKIIARRDLYEYQVGIKHKFLYSMLSGSAAIYTLGISELAVLPMTTEAARAVGSLRVYYDQDKKVYGSASYNKKANMWLPNFVENEGNFRNGFPCYDFSERARKVMMEYLAGRGRSDLVQKISNCLSLDRVEVAN